MYTNVETGGVPSQKKMETGQKDVKVKRDSLPRVSTKNQYLH